MWHSTFPPPLRQRPGLSRLLPYLLILGALLSAVDSSAQVKRWIQPDSVPALQKMYNVGDQEYLVGAQLNKPLRDFGDTVAIAWAFTRWMNMADFIWTEGFKRGTNDSLEYIERNLQMDTLDMLAQEGERLTLNTPPFNSVAATGGQGGSMVELYMFDSVQSPYYRWEFLDLDLNKGKDTTNTWYHKDLTEGIDRTDWPWRDYHTRERVYSEPGDVGLLAEHFVVNYDFTANNGWLNYTLYNDYRDRLLDYTYKWRPTDQTIEMSVALKGHLYPELDTNIALSDTIFILKLVHVVPSGKRYLDDNEDTITTSAYTEIVIDSFAVTKAQLMSGFPDVDAMKYRDVSFTTDLRYRFNNTSLRGPLHALSPVRGGVNSSSVIDVKVYWTGKEKAALRSVMIRNKEAELIYGAKQQSIDFRDKCLDSARRLLHGLDAFGEPNTAGPLHSSILSLDSGHEPNPFGVGTYRALNRLFKDSLVYNGGADSVPFGIIDHHPTLQLHTNTMGARDAIHRNASMNLLPGMTGRATLSTRTRYLAAQLL